MSGYPRFSAEGENIGLWHWGEDESIIRLLTSNSFERKSDGVD